MSGDFESAGHNLNDYKPVLNKKTSPQMRIEAQMKTIEATLNLLKQNSEGI